MAKIIAFSKRDDERIEMFNLNEFLERAILAIKNNDSGLNHESIATIKSRKGLKILLEKTISELIIRKKMIDRGILFCGIYIPILLTEFVSENIESWIAIDYLKKANDSKNSFFLKKGGDVCFIICTIFPKRGNWRLMDLGYYQEMGKSFYYQHFLKTDKELGLHMSRNFESVVRLTNECLRSLQ